MNGTNTLNYQNINIRLNIKRIIKIKILFYLFIKRFLDIIISSFSIVLLLPIFLIIIILIKKEDGGKSIYTQNRIGKNGKMFKLYKFRSMVKNADDILESMLENPEINKEYKKKMKFDNDPRVTKIGKFIRSTSIDELPQLINVFKGEMSLIGNRPYLLREKEDMGKYYEDIIKSKPGITGYWQTSGRNNLSFEERCKLESYYSNHMNLLFDFKIFFLTFYVVLVKRGAF